MTCISREERKKVVQEIFKHSADISRLIADNPEHFVQPHTTVIITSDRISILEDSDCCPTEIAVTL